MRETCKRLGLTRQTLWNWVKAGKLRVKRESKWSFFAMKDVERFG